MAGIILAQGKQIYQSGQPVTALHLITGGKVRADYPGGSYTLGKGDVIGVCELTSEVHFLNYTAAEETNILTYPINTLDTLETFLSGHPDVSRVFLLSMFSQIITLLARCSVSGSSAANLYHNLAEDWETYEQLCSRYRVPSRALDDFSEIGAYILEEEPDLWLSSYYTGLQHLYASEVSGSLVSEPGITIGMLRKGALDFRKAFSAFEEDYNYMQRISALYFAPSSDDLFDRFTSLYYRMGADSDDSGAVRDAIERMITTYEKHSSLTAEQMDARIQSFRNNLNNMGGASDGADTDHSEEDRDILSALAGSVNTILDFSGLDPSAAAAFRQHVNAYKALEDKSSTEPDANKLRRQLTDEFNSLYAVLFERAVAAKDIPVPVKMFLYFGYVDEELAGAANCLSLYRLAVNMNDDGELGVYTFFGWLKAIHDGRKAPSRNEFDEDYSDTIRKKKATGSISAAEADALENDPMGRVRFELENVFPSVNKVTCGRITTFCPLFASDNALKSPNASYVSPSRVCKTLEAIRSVDYTAYYRESMDFDNQDVLGHETIHLEFLPDVILMPNMGIRGVMWQEIEGKKRNSPARMFLSVFHMEDLNTTMVRLTGEFRWEMCKRIQGSRWNDISERSLTSEYFDYVQFYRGNHDLSGDAKERIKNSLQKARNSFKEMFVRDYIVWVLFEANGSPRLNKVARQILFTYCPFPAESASSLAQNPIFSELIERANIQKAQKLKHIDILMKKLSNSNIPIPDTLTAERDFIEGKV